MDDEDEVKQSGVSGVVQPDAGLEESRQCDVVEDSVDEKVAEMESADEKSGEGGQEVVMKEGEVMEGGGSECVAKVDEVEGEGTRQCDVVLAAEDEAKEEELMEEAKEVELAEEARVEEPTEDAKEGELAGELKKDGVLIDERKEVELIEEVKEVELAEEAKQEELAEEAKEGELAEEAKEGELAEEAKEGELAEEAKEGELAEEAKEGELAEEAKVGELAEEAKQEELVEEAKQEELIEEAKQEALTEESKEENLIEEAKQEALTEESKEENLIEEAKQEALTEESKEENLIEEMKQEALTEESKDEKLMEETKLDALTEESKDENLIEETKQEALTEESKDEKSTEEMKKEESVEEKTDIENEGEKSQEVMMEGGEESVKLEEAVNETGNEYVAKIDEMEGEEEAAEVEKGDEVEGEEEAAEVGKEEEEEEERGGEEMEDSEAYGDDEVPLVAAEDEEMAKGEVTPDADTEMGTESEVAKSGSGGKRRRGRNSKPSTPVKSPARKTVGEDVCFICLDGGNLVLCDRRGCPKAYHPSCVDHDEEFFKTKGRWNCGWHLCNQCGKNAYFLCYTCTFSLCKGCSKDAVIFCLRGSKGFCESCMKTVMMIESNEPNEMGSAFDDNSSWEYLFKDYWIEQKAKLCITSEELAQAKNPLRDSGARDRRQKPVELHDGNIDAGTDSDSSPANLEVTDSKKKRAKRKSKPIDSGTDSSSEKEAGSAKRKSKRRLKSHAKETYSDSEHSSGNQGTSNNRGKRVRRLSNSRSKVGGAMSEEGNTDWATPELLEFVMHMKNGDRSVLTQFDVQGLLLEYIKRNKLRDPRRQSQIICDMMLQKLFGKARVGHFEMLKLLESHFLLKEDSHVDDNQGTVVDSEISPDDHNDSLLDSGKARGRKSRKRAEDREQSNLEDYAAIDRHNISLIYLRRSLMESLMDDTESFHDKVVGSFVRIRISASGQKQDIYRLVQIMGTSKAPEPYKVGKRTTDDMLEILNLDKTEIVSIDLVSNQEFTEDECKRLRQSIKCGLISRLTVGDILEKAKQLQEVRVTDWLEAEIVRLSHLRDRASEKGRKKELRECVEKLQLLKTPEERQRRLNEIPEVHADPKMDPSCVSDDEKEMHDKRQASNMRPRESGFFRRGRDSFSSRKVGSASNDSWGARPPNKSMELGRSLSNKGFSSRREDTSIASQTSEHTWSNGVDRGTPRSNNWEKARTTPDTLMSTQADHSGRRPDMSAAAASEPIQPSSTAGRTDSKVNETEKTWHYRDPTGKVQGPFSMSQLRKWSNTGYFPAELRVWRTSEIEDDSILLTEALAGRFQKELSSSDVGSKIRNAPLPMDMAKLSSSRYESSNLPSPTPTRSPASWSGKQTSNTIQSNNQVRGNERLPSPTPTSPLSDQSSADRSKFSHQLKGNVAGNKQENVSASIGAVQPAPVQFVSNPGMVNAQQIPSQTGLNVPNQPFAVPDATMNQANVGPNAMGAGQGFSNMVQPGTGQNPLVYPQNWGAGYVARPEMVNANLTPNNQNAMQPAQVAYNQWTGAPVSNQAPPYAAGYPPGQGNVAANFPAMPMNTAWRPPQPNMQWGGQQQQQMNQNVGWAGPQAGAMAQMANPPPGAPAMAAGPTAAGWTGTGPSPTPGNTNMVWVGAPGNTGTWGGDQNRNGGGAQWNRQSSFGSGGQRVCMYFQETGHCRKGSSCDYMHT